jgi:hypothetical protein
MNLQIKTHQVVSKTHVTIEDNVAFKVFRLALLLLMQTIPLLVSWNKIRMYFTSFSRITPIVLGASNSLIITCFGCKAIQRMI